MFGIFVAIVAIGLAYSTGPGKAKIHPHNPDNDNSSGSGKSYSPPPPKLYNLTLGYDRISIFRPKFIYFEFNGLRPNTPHWIFFDGKQVNKWVNTDKTENDLTSAGRKLAAKRTW